MSVLHIELTEKTNRLIKPFPLINYYYFLFSNSLNKNIYINIPRTMKVGNCTQCCPTQTHYKLHAVIT